MNKLSIILLVAILTLGLTVVAQSAVVLQLNFNGDAATDVATYVGSGDIPTDPIVQIGFDHTPYDLTSARDYGMLQPDPGTDSGNYPDLVTPASLYQGDNAMFTALGDSGSPTQHVGWYIHRDNGVTITGDFTSEVVFMTNKIGTLADPIVDGSEYSLQNIFGNEMTDVGTFKWKFRIWPDGIIGGNGKLELWTNNGSEHNVDTGGTAVTTGVWHHAAAVYTAATDTIELFYDGVSQGTNNPGYATNDQGDWWVGDWPSNGAARGFAGWIDCVAISDEALTVPNFVLPALLDVNDWYELY